jgi:hypothetical protein
MNFSPKQYAELKEALLQNGAERSGRGIVGKEEALVNAPRKAVSGLEEGSRPQGSWLRSPPKTPSRQSWEGKIELLCS